MPLPVVAIIGRPNVGKSTFFNRICKSRQAITDDMPGVTRDRHYGTVEWAGHYFVTIDTGGLVPASDEVYEAKVREQAEIAIEEADLVLFMVDARVGPADIDLDIAKLLRKTHKPTLLVVNKSDNDALELDASSFYSLGLGDPFPIASNSGRNVGNLLDLVVAGLPAAEPEEPDSSILHVAVIGRPNVGKSSLVNRLLGDERLVVADQPGTTRDAIDTDLSYNDQHIVLIDTAGLRRAARVKDNVEFYTTLRSIRSLQRADIAMILVEAPEGITGQDIKIIEQAEQARKGILIVVNKWDLVEKDTHTIGQFTATFHEKAKLMNYIPLIFVSALSGQRVTKILDQLIEIWQERQKRIPTAELNTFLEEVVHARPPAAHRGVFIKFYYMTQTDVAPPTFVFFVNYPEHLDKAYLRYLENRLRERFGFVGNALRLKFNKRVRSKEQH
jgi:GTP-binding protein